MPKVIHEYWYNLTDNRFSYFQLEVNKETPKMFFGNALNSRGVRVGNFTVNKNNINKLMKFNSWKGIEYRVQTDIASEAEAKDMAKALMYERIIGIATEIRTL